MGARISKPDGIVRLIELPYDIQSMILGHFDIYTLLALTLVNKQFRSAVNARLWRSFSITESYRFLCPSKDNGHKRLGCSVSRLFLKRCEFISRKPHIAKHPLYTRKIASVLLPLHIRKISKALMALPNLDTLVIYTNFHLNRISSSLSANANRFPFKLRVIESNLICKPELLGFLEAQPQIVELGELRPGTDLYLEVPYFFRPRHPYLPPHVLPSLRVIRGSIDEIQELAPGRPINSILIHQAYDRVLALTLERFNLENGHVQSICKRPIKENDSNQPVISMPQVHVIIESDHSRDKNLPAILLHWTLDLQAIQTLTLTMARLPDFTHFPFCLEVFTSLTEIQWINRNEYGNMYQELAISAGLPYLSNDKIDPELVRKLLDPFILACVKHCPSIVRFSFVGYSMSQPCTDDLHPLLWWRPPAFVPFNFDKTTPIRDHWGTNWKLAVSDEKKTLSYAAMMDTGLMSFQQFCLA
ncbi:uncharacterized protein EI90DRAFT_3051174 [Cantharellus anzutake]|uniref:uncharacterized protein n=1 Tax=Cantharellus anzutake TaxID=1750568 RepID=UPI00190317F7|nr:uncharacterized protein EI90DRAFT_3051174 [Cantharellus anzutake]KAF8334132.1 hypothetical protein EI90DRAFT_3051174 [Cantharellus anzutake]